MAKYNYLINIHGEWVLHNQGKNAKVCWRNPQTEILSQTGTPVKVAYLCTNCCTAFTHTPINDETQAATVTLHCMRREMIYECDVVPVVEEPDIPEPKGTEASLQEFMSSRENP